jgi:protein-S-isoprenylcysteine O-methyltransferase Ste14
MFFWLLIHPWARSWRRLGPTRTYVVVFCALALLSTLSYRVRALALGEDLGTHWSLVGLSLGAYLTFTWLCVAYAWNVNHLTVATRMGVPELSRTARQVLVRDGIYAIIRHPVYLIAGVWGCP